MTGRLIAVVVVLAAVGVFIWGYRPAYNGTVEETLQVLGLKAETERVTDGYQQPGYEDRVPEAAEG